MLKLLPKNFTRQDLLNYITVDIESNLADMSAAEWQMLQEFVTCLLMFEKLELDLPPEKQMVARIFHGIKENLDLIVDYLVIPHNRPAALARRTIAENAIILSFLLHHDANYVANWFYWPVVRYGVNLQEFTKPITVEAFTTWQKRFQQDFAKHATDGYQYEQLIHNAYGWAFPALTKFINLESLAKLENLTELYEDFCLCGEQIHNNTPIQGLSNERFVENTFMIIAQTVVMLHRILEIIAPFMKPNLPALSALRKQFAKIDRQYQKFIATQEAYHA